MKNLGTSCSEDLFCDETGRKNWIESLCMKNKEKFQSKQKYLTNLESCRVGISEFSGVSIWVFEFFGCGDCSECE